MTHIVSRWKCVSTNYSFLFMLIAVIILQIMAQPPVAFRLPPDDAFHIDFDCSANVPANSCELAQYIYL